MHYHLQTITHYEEDSLYNRITAQGLFQQETGHLKNLIDWLSRPLVAGDRQTPLAINDKKIALSGAGGAAGTAKCREKLTELLTLPFIRADVMTEPQTGIQLNREAWTEGPMILTDAQRESLRLQVEAFLEYIG